MRKFLILAAALSTAALAQAQTLVASYSFQNSLNANQGGAPALTAIDPLGQNSFDTALVNGVNRTVYHWRGDGSDATKQSGLTLDATGLLSNYSNYSVGMTLSFDTIALTGGGWRRLIDFQGRQSDNGFYVNPSQRLEAVEGSTLPAGSTFFTTSVFHQVWLSVAPEAGKQRVKAWLDGQLEFSLLTSVFSLDNAQNPGHLLTFFADNIGASANQEFANGQIASLALYDGATAPVPEPTTALLWLGGAALLVAVRRRPQL
jgi:hypothetical protein